MDQKFFSAEHAASIELLNTAVANPLQPYFDALGLSAAPTEVYKGGNIASGLEPSGPTLSGLAAEDDERRGYWHRAQSARGLLGVVAHRKRHGMDALALWRATQPDAWAKARTRTGADLRAYNKTELGRKTRSLLSEQGLPRRFSGTVFSLNGHRCVILRKATAGLPVKKGYQDIILRLHITSEGHINSNSIFSKSPTLCQRYRLEVEDAERTWRIWYKSSQTEAPNCLQMIIASLEAESDLAVTTQPSTTLAPEASFCASTNEYCYGRNKDPISTCHHWLHSYEFRLGPII